MESIQSNVEASQDITRIYNNLKYNNTSDVNLTFSTDASGIIDLPERGTEIHKIDRINVHRNEIIHRSLKSHKKIEFFRDSSSIETHHASYLKFPNKEIKVDSLPAEITPFKLDLQFSKKVENLIIHDSIFGRFISEIERNLNEFIKHEHMKLENKIFFEEDWEIPDYEKLILSLNFKGIPFKREMLLWKMINTMVYERIKHIILYSSEEKVRRIKELKKKFFIKLEM